ncbi:MAG: serine protease [Chloroflexia bacterium]
MKAHRRLLRILTVVACAALLALPAGQLNTASAIEQDVVDRIVPAVVQLGPILEITDRQGAKTLKFIGWGSGSIIHSDGFILTNHHVTDVSALEPQIEAQSGVKIVKDRLAVFLTIDPDNPPVAAYMAEVRADDPALDLAVVKIVEDLSGKNIDGDALGLPTVGLGDSSKLKLSQKIHVLGYSAGGGETITFTSGDVSGFTFEAGIEGRAWIKTSAAIPGGNSGGAGLDETGLLVGVPTEMNPGNTGPDAECKRLIDTNGDGKIDDQDVCVPVGGPVNAMRPVDLARPLINQATSGLEPQPTPTGEAPTEEPTRKPTAIPTTPSASTTPRATPTATTGSRISRLFFANGLTDDSEPLSVVRSLPSGSTNLIFFFDFAQFEVGTPYAVRLFLDGYEQDGSTQEGEWPEVLGTEGKYWMGFLDSPLPDGEYEFQVEYDGRAMGSASIQIGGRDPKAPTFSNITFEAEGQSGPILPDNIHKITAHFEAANMKPNTEWADVWYLLDSQGNWLEIGRDPDTEWDRAATGTFDVELDTELGAPPHERGFYRVELLIDGELAATADVQLLGNSNDGGAQFGPVQFTDEVDDDNNPTGQVGPQLPGGLFRLYAVWSYQGMERNTPWNATWLRDGEVVADNDLKWKAGQSGTWSMYLHTGNDTPLADGEYEIRLSLEGKQVQTSYVTVGDSNRPTPSPTPDPAKGVIIKGTVLDAITNKPIRDAAFIVLEEGITWSTWNGNQAQLREVVSTNNKGQFQTKMPLERGHIYSMGILALGYQAVLTDDVLVTDDLPAIVEFEVKLESIR